MEEANFRIYESVVTELNNSLATYVNETSANICDSFSGFVYSCLLIYICIWGWSMLRGIVTESVADGAIRIVKLSFVSSLAMNVGEYNKFLSDQLWNLPDALAITLASEASPASSAQYLDELMSRMFDLGNAFWAAGYATQGLLPNFGLLVTALGVWMAGLAATGYGCFLLVLTKIALALLLGLGPIFVLGLLFDTTRKFFEAWLAQCFNYSLLVILSVSCLRLMLGVLSKYLTQASAASVASDPFISQGLPAVAIALVAFLVLLQVPSIAASLGGGVAISTLGAVNYAYSRATGAAAGLRPTTLRRNVHRLGSDSRIVMGAARAVATAPMSVYRKVSGANRNRIVRD